MKDLYFDDGGGHFVTDVEIYPKKKSPGFSARYSQEFYHLVLVGSKKDTTAVLLHDP